MAFRNIKSVKVSSVKNGKTYIIGDCFAVLKEGAEIFACPWRDIKQIFETYDSVTVYGPFGSEKLRMSDFGMKKDFFAALAIIEGAAGDYGIDIRVPYRTIPPKTMYIAGGPSDTGIAFAAPIDQSEIISGSLAIASAKMRRLMWLCVLLVAVIVFIALHKAFGTTAQTLLLFFPISVFSGGIAAIIIYIFMYFLVGIRCKSLAKSDTTFGEKISYSISTNGFAAVEEEIGASQNLIPWRFADYYKETDRLFIIVCGGRPAVYVPKRLLKQGEYKLCEEIISSALEQR